MGTTIGDDIEHQQEVTYWLPYAESSTVRFDLGQAQGHSYFKPLCLRKQQSYGILDANKESYKRSLADFTLSDLEVMVAYLSSPFL